MPQKTNLNVYPYFDDFDSEVDIYHKVLFKPGYPIQARELTTLQSILQNQIEHFGRWAFQEGSSVIPGALTYNDRYYAVELKNNFNGIDIYSYLPAIIGKTIRGQISGVRARILSSITSQQSERNNVTIYVSYLDSDYETSSYMGFSDGENLLLEEDDVFTIELLPETTLTIRANEAFASTIDSNCNSVGSQISVTSGVYFVRGYFVKNTPQYIILDQYSNFPSYIVGFNVIEDIVTSEDDTSLNDNAKGFSNYAAPGADRFSITLSLNKIGINDEVPENFIRLLEVNNGIVKSTQIDPSLNELGKEIARRTFDESGDYYVKSPTIVAKETLNDLLGNQGIYTKDQLTPTGNVPSEDLGTYQISPLKAYVRGYEINTISPISLDFPKARTTKRLENQSVIYETGSNISLNRVYGSPVIGFSTYVLSLRDTRVGINSSIMSGKEIGVARVYDFALESGSYNSIIPNNNEWDISLYDIQTYTEIGINELLTISTPAYIKGTSSGATGFLRYSASNSGILTAYNVSGNFINGEKLIFNDIENGNTRVSTAITTYTIDNVKSVYGLVGTSYTFCADTTQQTKKQFGIVEISAISTTGISTVKTTNPQFSGVVSIGDIVSYTRPEKTYPSYGRVNSVTATTLTISGINTVTGVCDGGLPNSTITVTDFKLLGTKGTVSVDDNLYTKLPKNTISDVDLTNSRLTIRKQFDVTITSNSTNNIVSGENEVFSPYDEERYILITQDGTTEILTEDKFDSTVYSSSGGSIIKFNGLSTNSGTGKLIATLNKINVKEKTKNKTTVKSIIVNKSKLIGSGIGETTLNNGLIYGNYPYGTRVEDDDICLLQTGVTKIYGIFEKFDSSDLNSDPSSPKMSLTKIQGTTGTTNDISLGEIIIGEISNAVAICVEKIDLGSIGFIYLNSNGFIRGETIVFQSSLVNAVINSTTLGDKNITSNYILDDGQRSTIYDYSRIIRRNNYKEPIRKIKIYFESDYYSTSDSGDITTVNSYKNFDYSEISDINEVINSDIIDIRPRVSSYVVSENAKSPFEFLTRDFSQSYNNSSKYILSSDEAITLSYSFYLPRIDKIFLSKDGTFQLKFGDPSENPQFPYSLDNAIEIASIHVPAYTFSANDVSIIKNNYKRYTMSDIGKLENRIENLEYYSTLSLLEKETESISIVDSFGNTRFKSGFFVDNFTTTIYQQKDTIVKNSIDPTNNELRPTHYTTNCDLVLGETSLILNGNTNVDINYSNDFISTNIKKTGNVITLDYDEVVEIKQQFSTRVVEVTSYSTSDYVGGLILSPSSDTWVSQRKTQAATIELEGDITETKTQSALTKDSQSTGFSNIMWNSNTLWVNNLISTEQLPYMRSRNIEFKGERMKPFTRVYGFFDNVDINKNIVPKLVEIQMTSGTFITGETIIATNDDSFGSWISNIGTVPEILKQKLNQVGVSVQTISDLQNLVSNNTSSNSISSNIILEYFRTSNTGFNDGGKFRLCTPNHKVGPYNAPTVTYSVNPYDRSQIIPTSYSTTSNILNIDTFSLSYQGHSNFYGNLKIGMKLTGETSNAVAVVKDIRLITDDVGTIIGSFRIPEVSDNTQITQRFTAGEKIFRLTNSPIDSSIPGIVFTCSEEKFYSQGTLDNIEQYKFTVSPARTGPEVNVPVPSPTPSYSPTRSYPTSGNPSPATVYRTETIVHVDSWPIPPQKTQSPVPAPIITVNGGGKVYADAAQDRIVAIYKELYPSSNVKNVEQVAAKLGVKNVDINSSGSVSRGDGNRLVEALQQAGAQNITAGPGSTTPKQNIPATPLPQVKSQLVISTPTPTPKQPTSTSKQPTSKTKPDPTIILPISNTKRSTH